MATYIKTPMPVSGALAEDVGVSATDLDIRDLSELTDSIEVSGEIMGDMYHDHPDAEILTGKYTTAQTDTVLKAIGANEKWVTTSIAVFCAGNNVVDCGALIEYDDAADVRIAEHPGIVAGSGFAWGDGAGVLAIGAEAQDVLFTSTPTVSGSIVVHVTGYIVEA